MKKIITSLVVLLSFAFSSGASAEIGTMSGLSQNDRSFYEKIQKEFGQNFVNTVDGALEKYKQRMNMLRWSEEKKLESHGETIMKVESMINKLLANNVQDIALSKKTNQRYLILSYLKFELMMLDFGDTMSAQKDELKERLTAVQYEVTQNSATELPFKNEYYDNFEEGIYVDIVDGKALFSSTDKFKTNTGWPAFSRPLSQDVVQEFDDLRYGVERIEVKSSESNSHLGHIFTDGPQDKGGLRYCINSASLNFIPKAELESQGYGEYLSLFE